MKLITVTITLITTTNFIALLVNVSNNIPVVLIRRFILVLIRVNEFMDLTQ
jgi:hypothetical protein